MAFKPESSILLAGIRNGGDSRLLKSKHERPKQVDVSSAVLRHHVAVRVVQTRMDILHSPLLRSILHILFRGSFE
jgi:hypothetical protein